MQPAQRFASIQQSLIRRMTRLAYEHGALNLSQGFPEFDPPEAVLAAAADAVRAGHNQYAITWGTPGLRRALADKYRRFYGMAVDPEAEITVTCGVSEAIMAAMLSVINPGEGVILLEPAHENYLPAVLVAGGQPIWVPLLPPDFSLDEAALREAFEQGARAIVVNTPHNPTGRVFSADELALIADLCRAHDVLAITDEIYEHMVYDGRAHIPLATLPGMAGRTVTTSGLSKAYAATGWRIGWAIAPAAISEAMRTIHEYMTICAPTPLQHAAEVAVSLPESFYAGLLRDYVQRRDKMMAVLAASRFEAVPPQGAYYVMADFSAIRADLDDMAFAEWLTATKKVAVVPGSSFYQHQALGRTLVRFAFPKHLATLDEVGRRLAG